MTFLSTYRELWIALVLATACTAALVVVGSNGWLGEADACVVGDQCFCERDRGGLIRTPANTLSNFGFIVAGLSIALTLGLERRQGRHPRPDNLMTSNNFYPGFYAAIAVLLGPGSMALHASLKNWGGVLDIVSMNFFIGFLFVYALQRLYGFGVSGFLLGWLVVNAVLLGLKLAIGRGSEAFGVVAALTLLVELQVRKRRGTHGDVRWLILGAGSFLLAFAIWIPSLTGGVLCNPDSLFQGHAAWHLLCASATVGLYQYARSERSV
jgi:hypothetical protein